MRRAFYWKGSQVEDVFAARPTFGREPSFGYPHQGGGTGSLKDQGPCVQREPAQVSPQSHSAVKRMMPRSQDVVRRALLHCGVEVNGRQPCDIQVHDDRFYQRLLLQGSMGLGESYMDGWWDCEALDIFFTKIIKGRISDRQGIIWAALKEHLAGLFLNHPKVRPYHVGEVHYDIGNQFYRDMIGSSLVYSCGYWKTAASLEEAQIAKMDLICRKLRLQKGQRLLDIGCGWGALAKHAALNYGVTVVGITVSREQASLAWKICSGLPIEIRLQDYHELRGTFDRIVSVGMFEHVGHKNYRDYMEVVSRCLSKDGLFLLHTIGGRESSVNGDPWISKYIFPGAMIPSFLQIVRAAHGHFVLEDAHNFGTDYDRTLMAWHNNFEASWPRFKDQYGERFYRMWRYYLMMCSGIFRAGHKQVWQIVFSKQGVQGGYESVR